MANNLSTLKIGIDPDIDRSGVAFVDGQMILALDVYSFFDTLALIDKNPGAYFIIEDVEHDKMVYNRSGTTKGQMLKIAQNVGLCKAVGRLLIQYLEKEKVNYIKVPPLQGYVKRAKTDAKFFNRLTGWKGSSNADNRDAALLALYGVAESDRGNLPVKKS